MKNNFNEKKIQEIIKEVVDTYLDKVMADTNVKLVTEMLNLAVSAKRLPYWLEKTFNLKNKCSTADYFEIPTDFDYFSLQKKEKNIALNNRGLEGAVDFYIKIENTFEDISYQDIQEVIKWMNNHGWYFACVKALPYHEEIKVFNQFTQELYEYCNIECKRIELHFRNIIGKKEINIPDICYHITPISSKDKILTNGLKPNCRARVETHPQRLYLYVEYPQENITQLTSNFRNSEKYNFRKEGYVVFKINMGEIKEKIPFYQDDNKSPYVDGIYTTEPINPKYIEPYQLIIFERNGRATIEDI